MPADFQAGSTTSHARTLLALIVVALTIIAVWKFIDYRTQPPEPPALTVDMS